MNDESDSFEQLLKRQSLRPVPSEWRSEILKAADGARAAGQRISVVEHSFLSNLNRRLASVLWPHPVAWAGLAAVWLFIFAANYSIQDTQPIVGEKIAPLSPGVMAELRQQQRLFVEVSGINDSSDADRQRKSSTQPHSERQGLLIA